LQRRYVPFGVREGCQNHTRAWFRSAFARFNNAATRLPLDHHLIEGLVAPRALLRLERWRAGTAAS